MREGRQAGRPHVAVVGDVMLDVAVRAGDLRSGGDVHGEVRVRPGGSGANAAVWAAEYGATVRLHGKIGADAAGEVVARELRSRGVEERLARDGAVRTGAMLVVRQPGERSMVADRGANATLRPEDLPGRIEGVTLLVSAYLLFDPRSEPAFQAALRRADAEHVAIDASSWPLLEGYGVERFLAATAGAGVLFANEREAAVLAGRAGSAGLPTDGEAQAAACAIAARYRTVCVKLGRRGAVLAGRDDSIFLPAGEVEELDPTGAGDAFDGTFLAAVASGADVVTAARDACAAGGRAASSGEAWPER